MNFIPYKVNEVLENVFYQIPGATICHTDPMVIEKMNSELRKKCELQRENDMATAIIADTMILL